MSIPPAENPFTPFIKRIVWIYALLGLALALTANILQWGVLDQAPTLLGSLVFCGGQIIFIRELQLPKWNQRQIRQAFAVFLMLGGITLQILQALTHRP